MQISTKEADTVGRLKQTFQAEGESSILSIKNIGADGSIMFGADHSRAVRLLRVHADTLDPPDARRRGRMAAGIVWAANYQRDSNNRRWELKGNMAVRHLRQCLRCVLVVSPERQRQMALRFPALVRSLQVGTIPLPGTP